MKPINKMAVAALLTLSSASLAFATNTVQVVRVTGSTAYRTADVTAETIYLNNMTGTGSVVAEWFDTSSSKSLTHANYSIVYGKMVGTGNTTQIVFENYWNGSIAGDEELVSNGTINFPNQATYYSAAAAGTAVTVGSNAGASGGGVDAGTTSYTADTSVADIAFSDVFYDTAAKVIAQTNPPVPDTKGTPTDLVVGVVPFVFVASGTSDVVSSLSGLSMNPQAFNNLWSNGSIPLSYFTGASTDAGTNVYALGRDIDSGTRATALAEPGYGLNGSGNSAVNNQVAQYYPYDSTAHSSAHTTTGVVGLSGSGSTIMALNSVPAENIDNYAMPAGDGGYNSGGNLATAMSAPYSGLSATVLMTYLGVSDAKAALTATSPSIPAKLMAYNGVTFNVTPASTANSNEIYYGKYTFWGYEHEFHFSAAGSYQLTAANGLQSALSTGAGAVDVLSSNGVTFPNMVVSRSDDGQSVQ